MATGLMNKASFLLFPNARSYYEKRMQVLSESQPPGEEKPLREGHSKPSDSQVNKGSSLLVRALGKQVGGRQEAVGWPSSIFHTITRKSSNASSVRTTNSRKISRSKVIVEEQVKSTPSVQTIAESSLRSEEAVAEAKAESYQITQRQLMKPYDAPIPRSKTIGTLSKNEVSHDGLPRPAIKTSTRPHLGPYRGTTLTRSATQNSYPRGTLKRPTIVSEEQDSAQNRCEATQKAVTEGIKDTGVDAAAAQLRCHLQQSAWRTSSPTDEMPILRRELTRARLNTPIWQRAQMLDSRIDTLQSRESSLMLRGTNSNAVGRGAPSRYSEISRTGTRTGNWFIARPYTESLEQYKLRLADSRSLAGKRLPRSSTGGFPEPASSGRSLDAHSARTGLPSARARRQTIGVTNGSVKESDALHSSQILARTSSLSKRSRIPTPMYARVPSVATDASGGLSPDGLLIARNRHYRPSNRMSLNFPTNPARTPSARMAKVQTPDSPRRVFDSILADSGWDLRSASLESPSQGRTALEQIEHETWDGATETGELVQVAEELNYSPASRTEPITEHMPLMWWAGRFSSLSDQLRTEELDIKTATAMQRGVSDLGAGIDLQDERHPSNTGMFNDNARHHVVFMRLRELCVTNDATRSFNEFRRRFEVKEAKAEAASPKIARKPVAAAHQALGKRLKRLSMPESEKTEASREPKPIVNAAREAAVKTHPRYGCLNPPGTTRHPSIGRSVAAPARLRDTSGRVRRSTVGEAQPVVGLSAGPNGSYVLPPAPKRYSLAALPSVGSSARLTLGNLGRRRPSHMPNGAHDQAPRQHQEQPAESKVRLKASMFGKIASRRRSNGQLPAKET